MLRCYGGYFWGNGMILFPWSALMFRSDKLCCDVMEDSTMMYLVVGPTSLIRILIE